MRESRNAVKFLSRANGHHRCYRALRPIRLCEASAGLSLFSQRVRTDALYEHSGVHAASNRQFNFFSAELTAPLVKLFASSEAKAAVMLRCCLHVDASAGAVSSQRLMTKT